MSSSPLLRLHLALMPQLVGTPGTKISKSSASGMPDQSVVFLGLLLLQVIPPKFSGAADIVAVEQRHTVRAAVVSMGHNC